MSKELLQKVIDKGVDGYLNEFFLDVSKYYTEMEDDLSEYDGSGFSDFRAIGEINFSPAEKLAVITANIAGDLTERSGKKAQYEKAKKILKAYIRYDAGIFVFSDPAGNFRLSLVHGTPDATRLIWSNFRRFTYFVNPSLTNKTFLDRVGNCSFTSLDIIKDAFSVEKVNKEFYNHIARFFYRLTGYECKREMTLPSVREDDKKTYQEFAVRLIGRAIFCWFLKHKKSANGISLIPESILSSEAVKQNSQYYHSTLEKLFFEVLNTPQEQRHKNILPDADKIPFLNGGLFEPHKDDFYSGKPQYNLVIPDAWFEQFFEILEQYNFTIDENSTVDADVSVDPEMLGRIFENLLAEVNPDTGETARKATGSYYTPRTIVDYMVDQSLKQYLLTKTKIDEDRITALLSYEAPEVVLSESEKGSIISALDGIKIIDPACGSGAFPMGILHKMLLVLQKADPDLKLWLKNHLGNIEPGIFKERLLERIRNENWEYVRKLLIIQKSIYGVDIQTIAVEISKLRFFLSLIVDEQIDDLKNNRGVEALPNLEFKFVAANSLIGLPPVINRQVGLGVNEEVTRLKELRNKYLRSYGREKKQIEEDFLETRGKLIEQNIKWGGKDAFALQLANWNPFTNEASDWFDPDWMFGVEDGFDIAIANPPYINVQGLGQFAELYRKYFNSAYGSYDIYILFFEKSLELLKNGGVVTFITSNKYFIADYGIKLRQHILKNAKILCLADLADCAKVFESLVSPAITMLSKEKVGSYKLPVMLLKDIEDIQNKKPHFSEIEMFLNSTSNIFDIYVKEENSLILNKMFSGSSELNSVADVRTGIMGFEYWDFDPYITDGNKKNHVRVITNSHLDRYLFLFGKKINLYKKDYYEPYMDIRNAPINANTKQLFLRKKIIVRGVARRLTAQIDNQGYAALVAVHTVTSKNEIDYDNRYLLALINSELFDWYHLTKFYTARIPKGSLRYPVSFLSGLPIKKPKSSLQSQFVDYVDKILAITKDEDYLSNPAKQSKVKEYERQIDQLVYQLYGLTPEEIAVVEGKSIRNEDAN